MNEYSSEVDSNTVMIIMIKREKISSKKVQKKKRLHALKHAQRKNSQKDMNELHRSLAMSLS